MSTATLRTNEPPEGAESKEIERHIEETREELGRTVEALSRKLDVKSRAKNRLSDLKTRSTDVAARTRESFHSTTRVAVGVGATVVAAVAGLVIWKRTR